MNEKQIVIVGSGHYGPSINALQVAIAQAGLSHGQVVVYDEHGIQKQPDNKMVLVFRTMPETFPILLAELPKVDKQHYLTLRPRYNGHAGKKK